MGLRRMIRDAGWDGEAAGLNLGFSFRVYCSRGIQIRDLARAAKMVDNGFLKGWGAVRIRAGEEPVKLARADVDEEWFLVMILMVTCGWASWIKSFEASCNGCSLGKE
ncbi:hypothetical protein Droror1_Dr00024488 [Drosera rotundifolia]